MNVSMYANVFVGTNSKVRKSAHPKVCTATRLYSSKINEKFTTAVMQGLSLM